MWGWVVSVFELKDSKHPEDPKHLKDQKDPKCEKRQMRPQTPRRINPIKKSTKPKISTETFDFHKKYRLRVGAMVVREVFFSEKNSQKNTQKNTQTKHLKIKENTKEKISLKKYPYLRNHAKTHKIKHLKIPKECKLQYKKSKISETISENHLK